jgi:hypothetical protein
VFLSASSACPSGLLVRPQPLRQLNTSVRRSSLYREPGRWVEGDAVACVSSWKKLGKKRALSNGNTFFTGTP